MTIGSALRAAAARLSEAGVDGAARDARLLMAQALGVGVDRLTILSHDPLPAEAADTFDALITRRAAREPVAKIIGTRQFWTGTFTVTPDVLDPRPDTETLIAEALKSPAKRILDLGTGSGIIAISLLMEWPQATAWATDLSAAAIEVARGNAAQNGVTDRITFAQSDWFAAVTGQYDLILSNPPYISDAEMAELAPEVLQYDPHMALTPGGDGLLPYRIIAAQAGAFLTQGGRLMVEIGHLQGGQVAQILGDAGFDTVTVIPDLNGRDRVVSGVWRG